ncbi:MAG: M3 family metallopeptidase, partial [Endozoicomonas sp.]
MKNPLLENCELPPFSKLQPEHVKPAIESIIQDNEKAITDLLVSGNGKGWRTLQEPIDQLNDRLSKAWSPVGHMNAVMNSEALRDAYNGCLPLLSEYSTRLGQNQQLFEVYQSLKDSDQFKTLDKAQQKIIEDNLRDFRLAGVALEDEKKQRFGDIKKQLSELTSKFSDNVLDATMAWSKLVTDESELMGLPESALAGAKQLAAAKGKDGWMLTLDFPSYFPVMTYCDNRELRKEVYTAFSTRASDQGPNAGEFDNTKNIQQILKLRHELAQLLGFNHYAEYSLATKMAESPDKVIDFLKNLATKSKPQAEKELAELIAFAKEEFEVDDIQAWDIGYYGEKLRQQRYAISQEELRPWFPAEKVISGMFDVVTRLYGIEFETVADVDTWHEDVRFFNITRSGEPIGRFYLDLYAREHKRGGAWMDVCRSRWQRNGEVQLPVAYLTCNFTPPVEDKPALLTHDEVVTLFHEFGHGLHHMLTKVDYPAISGISGVAWDAVELPSQFMENWCWAEEALAEISGHYQTGEPLPKAMLDK